mgnify:CR=1 FL=1
MIKVLNRDPLGNFGYREIKLAGEAFSSRHVIDFARIIIIQKYKITVNIKVLIQIGKFPAESKCPFDLYTSSLLSYSPDGAFTTIATWLSE